MRHCVSKDVLGICLSAVFSIEITGMGGRTLNVPVPFQELNLNANEKERENSILTCVR